MNKVFVTFHSPEEPSLSSVKKRFALEEDDIDAKFGVVEVDPDARLYTALVHPDAASKITGAAAPEGRTYSNPVISAFGSPQGKNDKK